MCVMDSNGRIIREAKILSEPDALIAWFKDLGAPVEPDRAGGRPPDAVAAFGEAPGSARRAPSRAIGNLRAAASAAGGGR